MAVNGWIQIQETKEKKGWGITEYVKNRKTGIKNWNYYLKNSTFEYNGFRWRGNSIMGGFEKKTPKVECFWLSWHIHNIGMATIIHKMDGWDITENGWDFSRELKRTTIKATIHQSGSKIFGMKQCKKYIYKK
jgi:hypothetical protein